MKQCGDRRAIVFDPGQRIRIERHGFEDGRSAQGFLIELVSAVLSHISPTLPEVQSSPRRVLHTASSFQPFTMGIIGYYVSVVLQIIPYFGGDSNIYTQQPLPINVPSSGVTIYPQLPGDLKTGDSPYKDASQTFKCHYPSLIGWESCNGPNSRDCWLRDAHIKQPVFSQFDIHTDYESLWPQGITREVSCCRYDRAKLSAYDCSSGSTFRKRQSVPTASPRRDKSSTTRVCSMLCPMLYNSCHQLADIAILTAIPAL